MRQLKGFITQKGFLFRLGLIICAFWIFVAITGELLATHDIYAQNVTPEGRFQPPSREYWFGTDELGRDVYSRVIAGARISLTAGLLTVVCAFFFGMAFGGIAGYKGGMVDEVMMRFAELFMSFPPIILAMVIAAALGPSIINSVFAMAIIWWPNYARFTRALVISLKENEYVTASRALGASNSRILVKELLPNIIGPLLVMATLDVGNAILMFSGLSFLGLGTQPPTPEWGAMVSEGARTMQYWWVALFPGIAIFTVALGFNFIGDGLRDYLDPKLNK